MSNPNIVDVTSILGKTSYVHVSTSPTIIISNENESNKVYKINTIIVSNTDNGNEADVSLYYNETGSAENYYIAKTMDVSADSNISLITKNTSIYLEENCNLVIISSADDHLDAIISYEIIS